MITRKNLTRPNAHVPLQLNWIHTLDPKKKIQDIVLEKESPETRSMTHSSRLEYINMRRKLDWLKEMQL